MCLGSGTQTCSASAQWEPAVACPTDANEQAGCSGLGVCDRSCKSGFGNCTSAPGCESPLNTITNCLACGRSCAATPSSGVGVCTSSGCGVTCNAGWADLNKKLDDGCERDLSTDPENCSIIGKSCYGGACSQSSCQFTVEKVLDLGGSGPVLTFQLDGGSLYVITTAGRLVKMTSGGSVATLASNLSVQNTNLIVDGGNLYFAETNGIAKMSTSGGTKTRVTTQTASRIDVEGGYVYFTTGEPDETKRCIAANCPDQNTVFRVSTNGGTPVAVKTFETGSVSSKVLVTGSQILVGLRTADLETLVSFDVIDPDATTALFSLPTFVSDFVTVSAQIFATDSSENLWRSTGAGEPELVGGPFVDTRKFNLTYDSTSIYGANAQRALARLAQAGGSLTAIAPSANALLVGPILDSSHAYWAGGHGGLYNVIYRVPKN
jgi:hypothetical protein